MLSYKIWVVTHMQTSKLIAKGRIKVLKYPPCSFCFTPVCSGLSLSKCSVTVSQGEQNGDGDVDQAQVPNVGHEKMSNISFKLIRYLFICSPLLSLSHCLSAVFTTIEAFVNHSYLSIASISEVAVPYLIPLSQINRQMHTKQQLSFFFWSSSLFF